MNLVKIPENIIEPSYSKIPADQLKEKIKEPNFYTKVESKYHKEFYPHELNKGWKDGFSIRVRPHQQISIDDATTEVSGEAALLYDHNRIMTLPLNSTYEDDEEYRLSIEFRMRDNHRQIERSKKSHTKRIANTGFSLGFLSLALSGTEEVNDLYDKVLPLTELYQTLFIGSHPVIGGILGALTGGLSDKHADRDLEELLCRTSMGMRGLPRFQESALLATEELLTEGYLDIKRQLMKEKLQKHLGNEDAADLLSRRFANNGREYALKGAKQQGITINDQLFDLLDVNDQKLSKQFMQEAGINPYLAKVFAQH